jgi:hypothetical protein
LCAAVQSDFWQAREHWWRSRDSTRIGANSMVGEGIGRAAQPWRVGASIFFFPYRVPVWRPGLRRFETRVVVGKIFLVGQCSGARVR